MNEQRDRTRERLVRVAVAENDSTAALIRDALQHAGIRSMLKNNDATSVTWGGLPNPWALEVWVLEGDADAAAALLGGRAAPTPLPPPSRPDRQRGQRWWSRLFRGGSEPPVTR